MTMPPGGYPPRVYEYTPGDLSGLSVSGMGPGQLAWVLQNKFTYVLQPAVGVADGSNILDTLDDVTLQWVFINYGEPTSFPGYGPAPGPIAAAGNAGAAATVSRSDHTHSGVHAFNGALGNVQYFPTLSVATPAALAANPTVGSGLDPGFGIGQRAFVAAMTPGGAPGVYVLQPAVSGTPDNFFVIATSDNPANQWVFAQITNQGYISLIGNSEINLVQAQTIVLVPPLTYFAAFFNAIATISWLITAKDGTVTIGPTSQLGTDAGISNLGPSTVQSTLAAGALGTRISMAGAIAGNTSFGFDLTAHGVRLQITSGAVLGTATVFRARPALVMNLYKP